MKTLGRIILLVVGAFLILSAVKDFTVAINGIQSYWGWQQFLNALKNATERVKALQYLTGLLKASGLVIIAASAIFAGIKGKTGFWFTIFSAGILALFIFDIIEKSKGGAFSGKDKLLNIFQLISDSLAQIGYVSGFILLKLSKNK